MLSVDVTGDFGKTVNWFNRVNKAQYLQILDNYGVMGVEALASATPSETGLTSQSWSHQVIKTGSGYRIEWTNSHVEKGVNIAILLDMGHGTRNGGYVEGRNYIVPALRDIFDQIAEETWKVVTSS